MMMSFGILNRLHTVAINIVNTLYTNKCRKRIRNKNFTIICSNCSGGVIYNRLGMKFLSPTINLWIRQYDFIKLVQNLKWYLQQELKFVESQYDFPVALLGDIRIHFNHAKDEEDAARDWNRRKSRVNFDNLYLIMYDRDGISREQILSLNNVECKNKIVFTERHEYTDIEYVYYIKSTNKGIMSHYYLDKDWFGIRTLEKNLISWIG